MKKTVIALALTALATTAAHAALEVSVIGGAEVTTSGPTLGFAGVVVGSQNGPLGIRAGFERVESDGSFAGQNRWRLGGSYDVLKVGNVQLAATADIAYLYNLGPIPRDDDGFGLHVGVGATLPLTNNVAVTADYRYQFYEYRRGNMLYAGLKYKF